jgi:hypothetical protein
MYQPSKYKVNQTIPRPVILKTFPPHINQKSAVATLQLQQPI